MKECLDTGWVSSVGSYVDRFEQEVAKCVGARYGVATSSGTAALHVALQVVGVEPEDEVLVSTLSFIAPANAVRYLGAWPVFIDAEPRYWQMDVEKVESFLREECVWQVPTFAINQPVAVCAPFFLYTFWAILAIWTPCVLWLPDMIYASWRTPRRVSGHNTKGTALGRLAMSPASALTGINY